MKRRTFKMLCARAKVWYTAMINGNCPNRTVIKHGMMICCLMCVTTDMLGFLLAMTFSVFLFVTVHPNHGLPVTCKSWVSVLVLDIKVLV